MEDRTMKRRYISPQANTVSAKMRIALLTVSRPETDTPRVSIDGDYEDEEID